LTKKKGFIYGVILGTSLEKGNHRVIEYFIRCLCKKKKKYIVDTYKLNS
jgi:hypothetical protein